MPSNHVRVRFWLASVGRKASRRNSNPMQGEIGGFFGYEVMNVKYVILIMNVSVVIAVYPRSRTANLVV